jgi:hypothetical protein
MLNYEAIEAYQLKGFHCDILIKFPELHQKLDGDFRKDASRAESIIS